MKTTQSQQVLRHEWRKALALTASIDEQFVKEPLGLHRVAPAMGSTEALGARHIMEIVKGFMWKIASRMDENGLPLAQAGVFANR